MPRSHPSVAQAELSSIARQGREWLFEAAAPQWSGAAKNGRFLFPERFSIAGAADSCPHRLFVQARHIFSFCEIGRLGWNGPWRDMAETSAEFLLREGRRPDGFYLHRFDAEGLAFDTRADLYDQAFMLLALAHIGRVTQHEHFIAAAEQLDDALDAHWRLPHGGYFEGEIAQCPPFRQNPHMHLLEGFIALYTTTSAPRWLDKAKHIAHLCETAFIDPATGALLEYFDESLRPQAGAEGRIVEPGHCFEWAWLMEMLAQWGVAGAAEMSDRLAGFARSGGIDPQRGVAINEMMTDGSVRNADARLWPQTERLKAALARFRRNGDARESIEAIAAFQGLTKYFDTPKRGVWRDKLRADGSWIEEPAPGSSLYHITCALAELNDTAAIAQA